MRLNSGTNNTSFYSLGGGTVLYGTPYITKNHTMIFFKLFIKLYTTILLSLTLLSSTMASLQVTGTNFASLCIRFIDNHNVPAFKWFPPVLIDHYDHQMPLNLYKTLFVDGTTCAELKPEDFTLLNYIYCKFIQTKSSHTAGSQETQDMKKMVTESCPLMYYSSNGDYELIEDTEELANAFNYFSVDYNWHGDISKQE